MSGNNVQTPVVPKAKKAVNPLVKSATGRIVAVTFRSDHVKAGQKVIRPSPGDFADATGRFAKPEWDAARGGNFDPHPISQTKATDVIVDIDVEFTITPPGRAASLTSIKGVSAGHDFLSFSKPLSQSVRTGRLPTITGLVSLDKLPNFVTMEDHGVAWTAVVDGKPVDLGPTLHRIYVTFDEPGGKMESTVKNAFTETAIDQDVTEERLAYSVQGSSGKGVSDERECVDALFLHLKALGVDYFLGRRWEPDQVNNTGLTPKPPLHQYLWKCNATTAKGECHNIAASFMLACRILGVKGPMEIGYMYPRPRRVDARPFMALPSPPVLGAYSPFDARYFRAHVESRHGNEQLMFLDSRNQLNNFEGVARYKNGLYAIGDAIFDQNPNDPQKNAEMYYAKRGDARADGHPGPVDLTKGVFDLIFFDVIRGDGCFLPYPGMTFVESFPQTNDPPRAPNIVKAAKFRWHH